MRTTNQKQNQLIETSKLGFSVRLPKHARKTEQLTNELNRYLNQLFRSPDVTLDAKKIPVKQHKPASAATGKLLDVPA